MDFERLTKVVHVTDKENWYGKDTVKVSLYVTRPYKEKVLIRILVESIDDKLIVYDIECDADNKDEIKFWYEHLRRWLYDKIPKKISTAWLYEHGYLPF